MLPIPDGAEELTADWLTEALIASGALSGATILSVQIDRASIRKGNLGRLDRIVLEYDRIAPGAPTSLIAKFHPRDIKLRKFVAQANLTEVRFYEELAPTIEMRTPRCYYSAIDEQSGNSVLLLEDLIGHRQVDEIPGCTIAEAGLVTSQLAILHAKWWNSPHLDEFEWLQPFNKSFSVQFTGNPVRDFEGWLPESVQDIAATIKSRYMDLFDLQSRPPRTVALNDIKIRHVLFSPKALTETFTVIDFQLVVQSRGVLDLARFYGGSLDTELRRSSEMNLLKKYHQTLLGHGVEDYSFDECVTDYRLGHLQNLTDFMAIEAQNLQQRGGERAIAIQKVQLARYTAAILDHHCGDLLSNG